jgi:hypothetical protein
VPAGERGIAEEQDKTGNERGGGCAMEDQDSSIGSALRGSDSIASSE